MATKVKNDVWAWLALLVLLPLFILAGLKWIFELAAKMCDVAGDRLTDPLARLHNHLVPENERIERL